MARAAVGSRAVAWLGALALAILAAWLGWRQYERHWLESPIDALVAPTTIEVRKGAPLASVEYSPVNVFGTMSDFAVSRQALGTPRTEHAGTQLGRYIYVLGGSDGDAALASGERALVLSPEESPSIDDLDLCLSQ